MAQSINCRPSSRLSAAGLVGKAGFKQGPIQPFAAAVAGKHSAGPVGAVRRRGQPNDQQPRLGIAEIRDRPAPVIAIKIGAPLFRGHLPAIVAEPGAPLAIDDLAVQSVPTRQFSASQKIYQSVEFRFADDSRQQRIGLVPFRQEQIPGVVRIGMEHEF